MAVISSKKLSATCNFNACFFGTFVLYLFLFFYLLDIIPLGLGHLWRVVELQVSDNSSDILDRKKDSGA